MILHCQVTIFPSYTLFFGKVTKCSPYPRYGKLCFMSWRRKHLHKLFGILLKGRGVPSPPLIYLFRHLCQYALMDIYFIRYVINYVIFLLKPFHLCPLGTLSDCPLFPLARPHHFAFWILHHFLARQDAPSSSCMISSPALELAVSPRSPGSLC